MAEVLGNAMHQSSGVMRICLTKTNLRDHKDLLALSTNRLEKTFATPRVGKNRVRRARTESDREEKRQHGLQPYRTEVPGRST